MPPSSYLPCVEIEPPNGANAAIIWLHGLGADGHDFEPIVPHLGLAADAAVRFVFPHAPAIPVTINGGMVMPAWYDILGLDLERKANEEQLLASASAVADLIARERERGIAGDRIVVAGFSQGGAVGYQVALSYPERLAGLLALSAYFATQESVEPHRANADLPVLICHGTYDPLVPESLGEAGYRRLLEMGYAAEYRRYPIEHAVSPEEIRDIGNWLNERLA